MNPILSINSLLLQKALSDSPFSVTYLASQINRLSKEVYEVLILMQLYGGQSVMQLLRQYHSQGNLYVSVSYKLLIVKL